MGLIIFWLVTPGDGELRPAEKVFFKEIQTKSKALEVWREPKYNISNPKDITTYRIIIRKKSITAARNIDSLSNEAEKISKKIDNLLILNDKFINYEIIYEFTGFKDESFKFKRSEISNKIKKRIEP